MNSEKTIQIVHKVPRFSSWVLLPTLALLIIGGCSYYKSRLTLKLDLEQSDEAPAVFEIYCGRDAYLNRLSDEKGQEIFYYFHNYGVVHAFPYEPVEYPLKLELKPGQYTLTYSGKRANIAKPVTGEEATLEMKSGHYYKFASYSVRYKQGWVWIEDLTTSEVVAGTPPPRGLKGAWYWGETKSHGSCRSAVLDYL